MKLLNKYLRGKEWLVDQYNRNREVKDHKSAEEFNSIESLTDEISFRLLATKNHPDYEWLKQTLKNNGK